MCSSIHFFASCTLYKPVNTCVILLSFKRPLARDSLFYDLNLSIGDQGFKICPKLLALSVLGDNAKRLQLQLIGSRCYNVILLRYLRPYMCKINFYFLNILAEIFTLRILSIKHRSITEKKSKIKSGITILIG